jgi:RNA polymerase sigma-70 factor (ECF subfamily)
MSTGLPDEVLLEREAALLVEKLLDQLDEEKREVLVLAELEQLSGAEIAISLGLNVNTVYARLRAARQQFDAAVLREKKRQPRVLGVERSAK